MTVTLETLALQIEVNHQELTAGLSKSSKKVDGFAKKTTKSFNALKTVVAGVFAKQFIMSVVNAASSMQQLEFRLKSSTGSAFAAAEAMDFLQKTAERQNVSLVALSDGYVRLLPSVKSGALEMDEMREMLSLVNDNMKAFGVSANDSKRVFFGLSQLLGSGVVTMENLKQVTEHLPGSLSALAKASNKSLGSLIKWVSTGQVTADMIKGPLTEALKQNEGAAEKMADTYDSAVISLNNAFAAASKNTDILTVATSVVKGMEMAITGFSESVRINTTLGQAWANQWDNLFKSDEEISKNRALDLEIFNQKMRESVALVKERATVEKEASSKAKSESEAIEKGAELEELEKERKKQELKDIKEHEKRKQEIIADSQSEMTNKTADFFEKLKLLEELSGEQRIRVGVSAFQDMLGEAAKHNKALFEINKVAGIANAVISTAQGVAKALELPFPLNLAAGATVAAAGAAQIATISSQQFGGGGGASGASAVASSTSSVGTQESAPASDRGLNIGISGVDRDSLFSGSQVGELIKAINEEIGNGAVIKGVSVV